MQRFLTALLLLSIPGVSAAEVRHYMAVFAFQDRVNLPKNSHTWAGFTAVEGERGTSETVSISWMPRTLQVVFAGATETGINLGVRDSIDLGRRQGFRVTQWGPYLIHPELFARAKRQSERLDRNEIAYQCLDASARPHQGSNCIHAVADIDTDHGLLRTGIARGRLASRMVLWHLRRWILDDGRPHPEVGLLMGID